MGIIKSNRVVIMLSGRYAGRKAVVVKTFDNGSSDRKFGHALVAGLDRYPRKITKAMDQKKVAKKSQVKAFVKYVNYSHIMPTRYLVDMDLKKTITDAEVSNAETRSKCVKDLKKFFGERYLNQTAVSKSADKKGDKKSTGKAAGVGYFFKKLRF